jgi:hypothetical protein
MVNAQFNHNLKNEAIAGNNEKFFDEWKEIMQLNDGKRNCDQTVKNSSDSQPPFQVNQKTNISITNTAWDVTNIRKGFITCRIRETVTIPELITPQGQNPKFTDPDRILRSFIGYKASNQAVRQMTVFWNNMATKYTSRYTVEEGFAYSNLRAWGMKDKKKFIYTLYENVFKYMPSVCGDYVELTRFQDGPVEVNIEFNLPVIDFLPLQCFDKWLKHMGDLYLETYFGHHSQVVALCNPQEVMDTKRYLDETKIVAPTLQGNITHFPHRFTQVGDPMIIWGQATVAGSPGAQVLTFQGSQKVRVIVSDMWVRECSSTMRGYGISDRAANAIMSKLSTRKLIIPAQELDKFAFPAATTDNGLNTALNIPYNNVTCACVVFPKT